MTAYFLIKMRWVAKAELSEPTALRRKAEDHQTKATPGITGWSCPRVHIDGTVRHLDVGSSHPGGGAPSKGMALRHLKWYVSWVQTVNQNLLLLNKFGGSR